MDAREKLNGIAISEIKGALVNNIQCADVHDDIRYGVASGWKQCREKQGQVRLRLSREKVHKIIWHFIDEPSEIKKIVDALCADPSIIEVVKD
jgi:hypothetical protein